MIDLPDDAIDLWHLELIEANVDVDLLAEDEIARADRFLIDIKAVQYRAGRTSLRRTLARYVGARPEELCFEYGEFGKPSLPDFPKLEFNLSHSHGAGLLGVCRGTPVGVDIEARKPIRRFTDLSKRFFTPSEHEVLANLPESEHVEAFYRAWTRKEAYLKAWGTGLSFPSNGFTIDYAAPGPSRLLATDMPGDRPEDWHFLHVATFAGFAAAVCFRGEARWLRHFTPFADE